MKLAKEKASRLRDQADVQRSRGDALRKSGREDTAKEAFHQGLMLLNEAASILEESLDQKQVAKDLAETLGAKGGMLRRLGDKLQEEAFQTYKNGAEVENHYGLSSTYNRLNAIKFSLLTGREKLEILTPRIEDLTKQIQNKLQTDTKLSDSGWAWADLGDCQALLGNLDAAQAAYNTFIDKAEIKSPETTLTVLDELADAMLKGEDPGAESVLKAAETLRAELQGGSPK